jgi:hypothetical protein
MPQICPWCQTEIIGDEAEEICPHCLNELGDYRTITVRAQDLPEEKEMEAENGESPDEEQLDEEIWQMLDELEEGPELYEQFESKVEKLRREQEESLYCSHCQEKMLLAGEQKMTADTFQPLPRRTFLQPPFSLNVYVCPACFHVQYMLAEENRMEMIQRLAKS